MPIKLNGATSGSVELDVPAAVGSDLQLTLPATAGDVVVKAADGSVDLGSVDIDSSGRLLVGTSTARSDFFNTTSFAPRLQVEGTDFSTSMLSVTCNATGANTNLVLARSRGTANGAVTVVANGDTLGNIQFQGADGTDLVSGASIAAVVDGTPGANDMPGRLSFSTTADGASSPTERMRINSEGQFKTLTTSTNGHSIVTTQGASSSINLFLGIRSATNVNDGTAVYIVYSNGTYATLSDETQKKNIESTRSGYLEDLKQLRVVKYNWKDQDDSEPKELGLIAQEVEQVFPGLVSEIQAESGEANKGVKAGVLPYMLLKALQEATSRIETLETQVAALEVHHE